MKAVILAGGLGTRLAPFTNIIPKPLLPIGDESVLEVQIDRLRRSGFNEIFLATNYRSEYFEGFFGDGSRYGVTLTVSQERVRLGTAGPVKLLQDKLTEPFLVVNGDILTLLTFRKFYDYSLDQSCDLCVGIKELITPFSFGNVFFEGNFVTGIQEKPDIKMNILAGIYFFRPELLDEIPAGEYFGMDLLIKAMLAKKRPIAKFLIDDYWLDIGRMDDFEKAEDIYQTHFANAANE